MKKYQTYYEPKSLIAYPQQRMLQRTNYTIATNQIRPSSSNPYANKATPGQNQNVNSTPQIAKSLTNPSLLHKRPSSPESKVLHDKFLSPYDQTRIASVSVKQLGSSSIIKPKSNVAIPFLPEKSKKNSNKKTLILDLDETLVHSSFKPFPFNPDICLRIGFNNKDHIVNVLKRPYVEEFLIKMSKCFELVIFTASVSPYANPLLDNLDQHKVISHRLFREHCANVSGLYIKDLKKVGRNLKDTIILDNNPISYVVNKENGLPILTWNFDKTDTELLKIIPFLEYLAKVNDVRPIIKKVVINNTIHLREIANDISNSNNNHISNNKNQQVQSSTLTHQSKLSESQERKDKNNKSNTLSNTPDNNKSININIVNHHVSNVYLNDYQQQENNCNALLNKKKNYSNINNPTIVANANTTLPQKVTNQPAFNSPCVVVKPRENNANYLLKSTNRLSEPISFLVDSNTRNSKYKSNNNNNYYEYINPVPSRSATFNNQNASSINKKDPMHLANGYNNNYNNNNIIPHPYIVKEFSASSNNFYPPMRQSNDVNNNITAKEYASRFNNYNQAANQYNSRPKPLLLKSNNIRGNYIDTDSNSIHDKNNNNNSNYTSSISQYQFYRREKESKDRSNSFYIYPSNQPSYYLQERENNLHFNAPTLFNNDYYMHNEAHFNSSYYNDNKSPITRDYSLSNRDRFYPGVNSVVFNS